MMPDPIFYIDTNIVRDNTNNRNHNSIYWVERIRKRSWKCYTSIFTFMEMLDIEQADSFVSKKRSEGLEYNTICRQRSQIELPAETMKNIKDKFLELFVKYPFIKPVSLTSEGWDLALHIATKTSIFAPDIIHLAAAWEANASVLITSDKHFLKHGNAILKNEGVSDKLQLCEPSNIEKTLEKMGCTIQHD